MSKIDTVWCCADAVGPEHMPPELKDNCYTTCEFCTRAIMHRPEATKDSTKLCGKCVVLLVEMMEQQGMEPDMQVSDRTRKEFSSIYGSKATDDAIAAAMKHFRGRDD